jgi:hypothetical protein
MVDKKKKDGLSAGDNSIVIGGSVQGSNIVVGNNNTVSNRTVNIAPLFNEIYRTIDARKELNTEEKNEAKEEFQEIQAELEKPEPNEGFLTRRFRNLQRMAPEIVDVAFETLKNPIGGVAEVVRRIAKKVQEEANAKKEF